MRSGVPRFAIVQQQRQKLLRQQQEEMRDFHEMIFPFRLNAQHAIGAFMSSVHPPQFRTFLCANCVNTGINFEIV